MDGVHSHDVSRRRGQNFEGRNQLKLPADHAAYLLAHRGSSPMFQNEDGRFRALEFGLLPIGMDAGNSLFLLGVEGELAGQVFFLSTFHIPYLMSYDHVGFIADSFTAFLAAARPMSLKPPRNPPLA
ncbi:hypothetical protein [Roseateles sp.]|uniref:hypothetical protein n=1 Tax=Roseateles sp. TaxID=1971397 RepID=UPI0031DA4391